MTRPDNPIIYGGPDAYAAKHFSLQRHTHVAPSRIDADRTIGGQGPKTTRQAIGFTTNVGPTRRQAKILSD